MKSGELEVEVIFRNGVCRKKLMECVLKFDGDGM